MQRPFSPKQNKIKSLLSRKLVFLLLSFVKENIIYNSN